MAITDDTGTFARLTRRLAYHYAELRSLLIEHADQLARDIDDSTEANDKALAVGPAGTAATARLPM